MFWFLSASCVTVLIKKYYVNLYYRSDPVPPNRSPIILSCSLCGLLLLVFTIALIYRRRKRNSLTLTESPIPLMDLSNPTEEIVLYESFVNQNHDEEEPGEEEEELNESDTTYPKKSLRRSARKNKGIPPPKYPDSP